MAAYMVTFGKTWMIFLGISFVVLSVSITGYIRWTSRSNTRKQRLVQRDRYVEYLAGIRAQARSSAAAQRAVGAFLHPSPQRLWAIAGNRRRVWERRTTDADFLRLRLGLGRGAPRLRISRPGRPDPTADFEPLSQRASDRLVRDYATVGLQPASVDVAGAGVISLLGSQDRTRSAARALLLQLAVLHAPDDVQLAVLAPDAAGDDEDFDAFIRGANARRLQVILDGVFNHVGEQFPVFQPHSIHHVVHVDRMRVAGLLRSTGIHHV